MRHAFQAKLQEYGMTCSMREGQLLGQHPDRGFNRFKNERVQGVQYTTQADMKAASFEYIEGFYNRKRQHSTLGDLSPIPFLECWVSQPHQDNLVA